MRGRSRIRTFFRAAAAAISEFEPHIVLLGGDYVSLSSPVREPPRDFLHVPEAAVGDPGGSG